MLVVIAVLAASQLVPPEENLAQQLRAEIWSDLQSNAMIGNGKELAAHWANAGSDRAEAPRLHIKDLVCAGGSTRLKCHFGLLREGGVATWLGQAVPDRLACRTTFRRARANGQWSIPRLPPTPAGGHSRITIDCASAG